MTREKREILLEIVAGILSKLNTDLLHERQFDWAEDVRDVLRQVYLLSDKLKGPGRKGV